MFIGIVRPCNINKQQNYLGTISGSSISKFQCLRTNLIFFFMFDEIVIGDKYLRIWINEIVTYTILQIIHTWPLLQQYGVLPHYSRPVHDYLGENVPEKWIGWRDLFGWFTVSSNFNLMGYFSFREYAKKEFIAKNTKVIVI